jgi:MYXO-CTERM domain-containing protein
MHERFAWWHPILVAALTALCAFAPARARACSCMQQSQRDAFEQAVAVFEGHVLEVKPSAIEPDVGNVTVRLKVVQAWKGTESEEVVLGTPANSAMCGYAFAAGQSYLVYASAAEGKLEVSLCSRTQPSAQAGEDMKALGLGATPVDPKADPHMAPQPASREPPARGGCAGCALTPADAERHGAALALVLGALALITFRRRSGSRS